MENVAPRHVGIRGIARKHVGPCARDSLLLHTPWNRAHSGRMDSSMRRGIVRFSTRVFGIDGMREMFVEDAGVYDYTSMYVSMHEYLHIDVIYTDIYSHTWSPG